MRKALSHPEIQKILHTLEKGKEKVQLESGEIPQNSKKHETQAASQPQRDTHVGTSRMHEQRWIPQDPNPPDSPQFSFMKNLEDIVPPEAMYLDKEEPPQHEAQSKQEVSPNKEKDSKEVHHKKKHSRQKTFKSGDKDVKFDSYNGRRDNDKALAFIRQFDVAFAEGNFKERSKLRHASMYIT